MAVDKRELELQGIRALRGSQNSIERKYMALYDEKVRLCLLLQEYEKQIPGLDRENLEYRNKYRDTIAETVRLGQMLSFYEAKLQQMEQSFGELKRKYKDSVARFRDCDDERRKAELENIRLLAENADLRQQIESMKAAYVKLQEKSNAVFVAGQELEKRYNHLSEVNGYLEGEKVRLEEENLKFRGQLASDKRSMFGSKSERTDNIFTGDVVQEDPIAEDAPIEEECGDADGKESNHKKIISVSAEKATAEISGRTGQQSLKQRNGGNSKTDAFAKFSHLDQVYHFERDEEKNADPRLELLRYEDHWEVRETRPTNYVYHIVVMPETVDG